MHPPLFVLPLTADQSAALRAGLRSADAFTARRCQIALASARGLPAKSIAQNLGCSAGTARNAIRARNAEGAAGLAEKSSRPESAAPLLPAERHDDLRALPHRSPRSPGKGRSAGALALLAEAGHERGRTPRVLSIESARHALDRLGVSWRRAKHGITSPDPAHARRKGRATG